MFLYGNVKFHPGHFRGKATKVKKIIHQKKPSELMKTGCILPMRRLTQESFFFFSFHSSKYFYQTKYIEERSKYIQNLKCKYQPQNVSFLQKHLRHITSFVYLNRKLVLIFLKVLALWRQRKYGRIYKNAEDPITMIAPTQSIVIFDMNAKGCFVFEAKSLKRSIESNLFANDWMFIEPKEPKNVLTNLPFTTAQMIHICNELKKYGQSSWAIDAYRRSGMNMTSFSKIYSIPLQIEALKATIRNPTSVEFQTLLKEFIEDYYDQILESVTVNIDTIFWAIEHYSHCNYIQRWIALFERYYTLKITAGQATIGRVQKAELFFRAKKLFLDSDEIHALTIKKRRMLLETQRSSSVSSASSTSGEITLPPLVPIATLISIPTGLNEEVDIFILGDV